ncbi:MAG: TlpA family protein disulfide reductase [Candidatus Omnitrophica bacterium]|nr:TlpA family protein disulfide reductase [Candidatus Omnitrophota bacterium]MBU4488296.1 TlpA family protein disulfide reductase [Candidatus Omnitrophota bacterium]MCG2704488.1 TlpA family protein disulfide reductase [Candidatus Omnitrophota bacterium]
MVKKSFIFPILISMILFAGCSVAEESASKKAPNFSLPDIKGKTVRLSDYNNKVVLLNFFATWCPPCREEIPDFIDMVNTKDSEKFIIIGISMEQGDDATVKRFAAERRINYPVLIDDGLVSKAYGPIYSIPTTFIIDKKGNITQKIIGSRTKKEFEKIIEPLL